LQAVVWATGYKPNYNWIDLPVLDVDGWPRHHRGLTEQPGFAFLGLPWLDSRGSALMGGVTHDARRVVKQLLTAGSDVASKKGNRN
jgi:putative flavoprotein involved in K+ transport